MAQNAYYKGLEAGMAGMSLQGDSSPSAPPPTAPPPSATPPIQVPPPYNPAVERERPILQQQVSMPNLSYSGPPDSRGSESFVSPPPYTPEAPRRQSEAWGQTSSYPENDPHMFMSLPRQPPQGSWGAPQTTPPAGQGYAQPMANPAQSYPPPQNFQRPQSYHQQQPPYGAQQQPGYGYPQQGTPYVAQAPTRVQYVSPCKPNGYNVMELFRGGNILYLIPQTDTQRAPMRMSDWPSSKVCGGGSFNSNDTKFEIVVRVQDLRDWRVCLKNCQQTKFVYINSKGDIKAKSGLKDDCDFHVRPVGSLESSVVCLESAANPGMFLNLTPGSTLNASKVAPSSQEAQFTVRAHIIRNVYTSSLPLKAYGRVSVLNQIADRCTMKLRNKNSKLLLGINIKGKVVEIQDESDPHALFMVLDRGMGVVSLRSWKHPGYWLRINGVLMGKGIPNWVDGDFYVKESYDGTVCLESVGTPGIHVAPPNSTCSDFTLLPVRVQR